MSPPKFHREERVRTTTNPGGYEGTIVRKLIEHAVHDWVYEVLITDSDIPYNIYRYEHQLESLENPREPVQWPTISGYYLLRTVGSEPIIVYFHAYHYIRCGSLAQYTSLPPYTTSITPVEMKNVP